MEIGQELILGSLFSDSLAECLAVWWKRVMPHNPAPALTIVCIVYPFYTMPVSPWTPHLPHNVRLSS